MSNLFTLSSIPSTTSVLSTYTAFSASAMLVRTVINEFKTMTNQLLPQLLQDKIMAGLGSFFKSDSSLLTLVIDESIGFDFNEIYQASEAYLSTRITSSINQLKVSKAPKEKSLTVTIDKGQKITDEFEGIQLVWEFLSIGTRNAASDPESSLSIEKTEHKSLLLRFQKQYKDKVLNTYLPHVLERSKALKHENRTIKLYSIFSGQYYDGPWGSINLDHPSTFETIAMDPVLKRELMDDLDRFLKRREFYRRVGKPWKRGYLLYGPPGTGKSSLIAAMANYLKFNIYDLELTSISSNSDLQRLLTTTSNKSILVIEDIDCSIELQDRQLGGHNPGESQLTLSGLLNFVDGLWSSCGDEKIIVFTTNYKEKLDPALLRPGRMDMHIHMSYCTRSGFGILAHNYLKIRTHCLFTEIEELIEQVEVTPAEVAEQLMKGGDVDVVLKGLKKFLQTKKEIKETQVETVEDVENERGKKRSEMDTRSKKKIEKNRSKRARRVPVRFV